MAPRARSIRALGGSGEIVSENTKDSTWSGVGFGAYFGGVSAILRIVLMDAFSFNAHAAFTLAIFLTSVGAYPIFIRGTEIRKRSWFLRGERWTFLPWLMLCILITLIAVLLAIIFLRGAARGAT